MGIDKLIPLGSKSKTSIEERVKAMMLNGLGFVDTRLYMFPEFLSGYPIQRLFGRDDIRASDFNDDALGRCLDKIAEEGITRTFSTVAMSIGQENGLLGRSSNVDTTSLSVYGDYEGCDEETIAVTVVEVGTKEITAEDQGCVMQVREDESPVAEESAAKEEAAHFSPNFLHSCESKYNRLRSSKKLVIKLMWLYYYTLS